MRIVDGHSHMYQPVAPSDKPVQSVKEIADFDIGLLLKRLDEIGVTLFQTQPQEQTRVARQWVGSNALSADIQRTAPSRVIAFGAAEPLDTQDVFNSARLKELRKAIVEQGLKGFLLTPPYGHYYANDPRVYPFYDMAVELDVPIYFHHSHMFGPAKYCPLKYARIWFLDDLTIDFPDLRFSVEHMGYPWTEELLSIMARSPNVYTDIAMFIDPPMAIGLDVQFVNIPRRRLLARDLGMAREYGVLNRVFYGSDCCGTSIDDYVSVLQRETAYIVDGLNADMEKLGYPPLTEQEMEGLLSKNVLELWRRA